MLCRVIITGGRRLAAVIAVEVRPALAGSPSRLPRPARLYVRRADRTARVHYAAHPQRSHRDDRRCPLSGPVVRRRETSPGRLCVRFSAVGGPRLAVQQDARLCRGVVADTLRRGDEEDSVAGRVDAASVTGTQTSSVYLLTSSPRLSSLYMRVRRVKAAVCCLLRGFY